MRHRAGLVLALLVAYMVPGAVTYGQDIVDQQDAQLWVQVNSQLPVSNAWTLILEGQPRWNQNFTHYEQVVLRAGVNRRLTQAILVGAAYAFVPRRTIVGATYEHQSYQQIVFTLPRLGQWAPTFRVREDQRYLRQWGDASHRIREQLRVTRALPKAPAWLLVLNQETFVNLDDTARGPARGLDQLRAYSGVQHALTKDLAVEVGYMWQEVFRLGLRPHRRNHNAMVQFQYRPRRAGPAPASTPLPGPVMPAAPTDD